MDFLLSRIKYSLHLLSMCHDASEPFPILSELFRRLAAPHKSDRVRCRISITCNSLAAGKYKKASSRDGIAIGKPCIFGRLIDSSHCLVRRAGIKATSYVWLHLNDASDNPDVRRNQKTNCWRSMELCRYFRKYNTPINQS